MAERFFSQLGAAGHDLADAFAEAVGEGLAAVDLDPEDIETGHVGNFAGELFAGQGLLGGFFGQVHPALDGLPTARHEAACASGSVAILAATAEIEAGATTWPAWSGSSRCATFPARLPPSTWARPPGSGDEFQDARFLWPRAFSDLADEYDRRHG
jgi:acetyl-CoA C-acetyltransferase